MKRYLIILIIVLCAGWCKGQISVDNSGKQNTSNQLELDRSVVASGGGYLVTSQGVSFQQCIGETVIQTLLHPQQILTQGFEQPHLLNNRFREVAEPKTFDLVLYPNPTSYLTKVKFVLKQPSKVKVELIDGLGRILSTFSKTYELGNVEIPLDVKHLAIGGYYVQVYINNERYERKLLIE